MNVSRIPRGWGLSLLTVAAVGVLVATIGQTRTSTQAGKASGKLVLYSAVGPELTRYDVDVTATTLTKRESMMLPGFITEATIHPSKKYFYIVWGGFPGGGEHGMSRVSHRSCHRRLDAPRPVGVPAVNPGIHQRRRDGRPRHPHPGGGQRAEPHQRAQAAARRDDRRRGRLSRHAGFRDPRASDPHGSLGPDGGSAVPRRVCQCDPSVAPRLAQALRVQGRHPVTEKQTVMPGEGLNFQARHMDFHPSGKWDYFTLERQNKMLVYERMKDGSLGKQLYATDTLSEPGNVRPGQIAGTVHVHPNGKFVYLANRASGTTMVDGKRVFRGGENTIAVFSINQSTGEPTLIQNIDTHGIHARTFTIDPTGKMLVAGNLRPLPVKDGNTYRDLPAEMATYHMAEDGETRVREEVRRRGRHEPDVLDRVHPAALRSS